MKKLWGKRFSKEPSPLAERFTSGRDVRGIPPADERLIPYDLWGSRAHVVMLAKRGIIPREKARALVKGLQEIEGSWRKGNFRLDPAKEDVHSNIESRLIEKYGPETGGMLHTARSRNDQIALDMRLYLRDQALDLISRLLSLTETLMRQARKHRDALIPGYSHHQPAQLTTLGHVWLSFAEALLRDSSRLQDWYVRCNQNPLGSMTGYGTTFPIDRRLTSKLLDFEEPSASSLDPIQNRWEPEAEMAFAVTAMMNHLSSLAQTLILFTTAEFGMLRLDEAYSTGSSMMPQKRNPDPLEVIRAKADVARGILAALLGVGQALFLGYNRDTQWTKYLVMDLLDECTPAPEIMGEIVESIQINPERMAALCRQGFIAAPDLLEKIVQVGNIPFRQGKEAMEKAVKYSEKEGLEKISGPALGRALREEGVNLKIDERLLDLSGKPESIVARRKSLGGPSPQALERHLTALGQAVKNSSRWLGKRRNRQLSAKARLSELEKSL